MTDQIQRPSHSRLTTRLTPAEKQAAYRRRRAIREQEQQSSVDFKKCFDYQINYEISQAEKAYKLCTDEKTKLKIHAALNALIRFKMIMDNSTNVTEVYKQSDLF